MAPGIILRMIPILEMDLCFSLWALYLNIVTVGNQHRRAENKVEYIPMSPLMQ